MVAKIDPDTTRRKTMQAAWDAYYGRFPKPLKVTRAGMDDNIIVNKCRPIVDKGVSFLFGQGVNFDYDNRDTSKTAQKWLDSCWRANRKGTFLAKLATIAGVTGHAFVKIIPNPAAYPRLVIWDASQVIVTTAPDDLDDVTAFQYFYTANYEGQPAAARQYISKDAAGVWTITDQILKDSTGQPLNEVSKEATWHLVSTVTWPYPFSPIVSWQNLPAPGQYWGTADLTEDLIAINRDINGILSLMSRIIRYHAFPQRWGKGFDPTTVKVAVDNMIVLPDVASEIAQLPAITDMKAALDILKELTSTLDELSRVPGIALGRMEDMPKGNVSGIALKVLYSSLLEKTSTKQGLYGEGITELNSRLLVCGGYPAADVDTSFPNPLPVNELEDVQVAAQFAALGASKHTVFSRAGLDWDDELEQKKQEVQAMKDAGIMPDMTPKAQQDPETTNANAGDQGQTADSQQQDTGKNTSQNGPGVTPVAPSQQPVSAVAKAYMQ